jgi:hypothetical protein
METGAARGKAASMVTRDRCGRVSADAVTVTRFCKVIPFRYSTTLQVTGYSDGIVYFAGSHNLGPLLGTFANNAWANDRQFVSAYTANRDQGQFSLSR